MRASSTSERASSARALGLADLRRVLFILLLLACALVTGCNWGVSRNAALEALGGDHDGDGWAPCGEGAGAGVPCDCDDQDAQRHPGLAEVCDGKDNDCDGMVDDAPVSLFYQDQDRDGHGNLAVSTQASCAPAGFVASQDDCDDKDPLNYGAGTELCDGRDNDCDKSIDNGLPQTVFFVDGDNDGFGDVSHWLSTCHAPQGYVSTSSDCDDGDSAVYPGATDSIVDGRDGNCDGAWDTISTVAGGGPAFSTQPVQVRSASLGAPVGMAIDILGNLYVSDITHNVIRKLDDGVVLIVAGIGQVPTGDLGDEGAATLAQLYSPIGLSMDGEGNLFIADALNDRIRRVDPSGMIVTVAGNGTFGFDGDGGPATLAQLYHPARVSVDREGNLFIADEFNLRIRKVDSSGTITTVAGNGESGSNGDGGPATLAQLDSPTGVTVDGEGDLYIVELDSRIRKVNPKGIITTVAGMGKSGYGGDGGPATLAEFYNPAGISVDREGNLYIADSSNDRVRKVDRSGTITTVAGSGEHGFSGDGGPATLAQLINPEDVLVDVEGNLYIVDSGNSRIRKVDLSGTIVTLVGNGPDGFGGDGGAATLAQLLDPTDVSDDNQGNLYIADSGNFRIRKVDLSGTISTVAGNGGMGFSGDGGPATLAQLSNPSGVSMDRAGNLYFADGGRIRKVDQNGKIVTVAGNGAYGFNGDGEPATLAELSASGVSIDGEDNLYIADASNNRIRKVDSSGTIGTVAGNGDMGPAGDGGPATLAQLNYPSSVSVDGEGNFYIADFFNARIRKVDVSGTIFTVVGDGEYGSGGDGGPATLAQLRYPTDVSVDERGNLFIADSGNDVIRRVDRGGTIITVAGNGIPVFGGDGGPATLAPLYSPVGVFVDRAGNLYIADSYTDCIRRVTP